MRTLFKISMAAVVCAFFVQADRVLINEIVAVVYYTGGQFCILRSDVRPALDGRPVSLTEVVLDRLMEADAIVHKMSVAPEEAEAYIEKIQKQNGLSRKAVEQMFTSAGYTYAEARDALRRRQVIEQIVEFRVRSDKRMIIDAQQARDYYDTHVPMKAAEYTLAIAFIDNATLGSKTIEEFTADSNNLSTLSFDEPFTLKDSEITPERRAITQVAVGEVGFVEQVDGGYEITVLQNKIDAQAVSFDDAYNYILNQMRSERFQQVLADYQKKLFEEATIQFMHPEDEAFVRSMLYKNQQSIVE